MRGSLQGRSALVTGAGRGIGRGIAEELADRGAAVGLTYRADDRAAAEAVEAIEAGGGSAVAIRASMTDPDEVGALAATALERLGHVDLLVHNAGMASRGRHVADTEAREILSVMTAHALGAHRLTAALLPELRRHGRADVIAISSSEVGVHRAGGAPYGMAKAALEELTLTLAREEAVNGIRANIVAPGLTVTDMGAKLVAAKLGIEDMTALDAGQPFGRVCRPRDIARVVAFLASDDATMVTGQRIVVDGGADAFPDDAG